ncbi:UNVERIFIED_CONTAM: hypothetical protein HDU68_012332 [Siphonaria sp. JEL0065]|nr:hypothetical protein HDU68_012332 [Siphonaria sp. JEL0065]
MNVYKVSRNPFAAQKQQPSTERILASKISQRIRTVVYKRAIQTRSQNIEKRVDYAISLMIVLVICLIAPFLLDSTTVWEVLRDIDVRELYFDKSPMQQLTPRIILNEAQNAIASGDLDKAVASFSILIELSDKAPSSEFNPVLAVLSRASCYMQLKKYYLALEDATKALKLGNIQAGQELYPGCYTSRSAAASYAADASKVLGRKDDFLAFKRMATELMKTDSGRVEAAQRLKDDGNKLFKEGRLELALKAYTEALKQDATNSAVLSNTSLVLLKLGNAEDALKMAERCCALKPNWSKGFFRKGSALLKLGKPTQAASAFQEGLQLAPDDAELKTAYLEAVKQAKISPDAVPSSSSSAFSKQGQQQPSQEDMGHAKKMMGMMMDLKYNSWDIQTFFSQSPTPPHLDFSAWNNEIAPLLGSSTTQTAIFNLMKLAFPGFQKGSPPVGLNPYLSPDSTATSWTSHILPDHPLITALILLHLLTTNPFPTATLRKKTWTLAFTHQADPSNFLGTSLHPYISLHRTYVVLINRQDENESVLDFLALWNSQMDSSSSSSKSGSDSGKDGFMQQRVLKQKPGSSPADKVVVYTCDDWLKGLEYVGGYYEGLENSGNQSKKENEAEEKPEERKPSSKKETASFLDEFDGESAKHYEQEDDQVDDDDKEFKELQTKIKTMDHIVKPKGASSSKISRFCWGLMDRESLFDVGLGVALFAVGAGLCILYL